MRRHSALALDFDARFAAIGAAFGADSVSDVIAAAALAHNQVIERERIMSAAFIAAAPGMAFLG
jgi:hypothetical protein